MDSEKIMLVECTKVLYTVTPRRKLYHNLPIGHVKEFTTLDASLAYAGEFMGKHKDDIAGIRINGVSTYEIVDDGEERYADITKSETISEG